MKPTTKKLLIVGGLLLAGTSLLAFNKARNLTAIFDKMTIRPNSLPKKIKATLTQITFDIDVILNNPTGEDFAVAGYVATLTQVKVYFKGKFLGVANVHIDEISVPRYDSLILKDIPVIVSTANVLTNLPALITEIQTANMNDLQFTAVAEVLGIDYEIGTM